MEETHGETVETLARHWCRGQGWPGSRFGLSARALSAWTTSGSMLSVASSGQFLLRRGLINE